jgi:D-inositol-3-phosphate glycosyltransferase
LRATNVALLTGGSDKPYALGLASALAARGVAIDFIGSDELNCPAVHAIPDLRFLNLRGDQREGVKLLEKASRILKYYARLLSYVAGARTPVLHILWNNKFELFDRTLLMAYYRLVGKRVVLTAHNVNVAARDGRDRWLNRQSLRIQYRLCHHIFVHTSAMKAQLIAEFGVPAHRVTVIPFGINDTIPRTGMTRAHARQQLGIGGNDRTLLFFGQIAPYKGLEYLVDAIARLARTGEQVRLIIAGKVKRGSEDYWRNVHSSIAQFCINDLVSQTVRFIPDDQVEPYFLASDAVVIPYVDIFQSGVPFLAFSFGLPVIATDVGSLRDDVTSETGVLCKAKDAGDLARAITEFYKSDLYRNAGAASAHIRWFAAEQHSWETVSERTKAVYASLAPPGVGVSNTQQESEALKCRE